VLDSKLNHVKIPTGMKVDKNVVLYAAYLFFIKIHDVLAVLVN